MFMDTIIALTTPPGRSGIAVIRLSGRDALNISRKLINDAEYTFTPRKATLKKIFEFEKDDLIDEAVFTYFKSPKSFTGEDVVEISCHGSPILVRQIIDLCLKFDARLAEPGEFSLRALSNGRINLSQAEAIRDLIESQTIAAARQSVRQLRGELSHRLQPLKDDLLSVIVLLESALEFVEDDLPDFQTDSFRMKLIDIVSDLNRLASTFEAGKLLRDGLKVAFAGRPNVGKSSLFNALLGYDRAIVTDIPGTTRDSLNENLNIGGIPISLIDTAGLRHTSDTVEKIGVERTKQAVADADFVIVVLDGAESLTHEDRSVLEQVKDIKHLIAINKLDLNDNLIDIDEIKNGSKIIKISALSGIGLNELKTSVVEPFSGQNLGTENFLITDARHADLLNRAASEIKSSVSLIDAKTSEEIILVGLHNALRLLGEITGETTTEDMLTQIFSTFCIGK